MVDTSFITNVNMLVEDIKNYRIPASEALAEILAIVEPAKTSAENAEVYAEAIPALIETISGLVEEIQGYRTAALAAKESAESAATAAIERKDTILSAVIKTSMFVFTITEDTDMLLGPDDNDNVLAINVSAVDLFVDGSKKTVLTQTSSSVQSETMIAAGSTAVVLSTEFYVPG